MPTESVYREIETPWMTLAEACEYARAGRSTVLLALEAHLLRGHQTGRGGRWRIHRDNLDSWLRGERPTPISQRIAETIGKPSR